MALVKGNTCGIVKSDGRNPERCTNRTTRTVVLNGGEHRRVCGRCANSLVLNNAATDLNHAAPTRCEFQKGPAGIPCERRASWIVTFDRTSSRYEAGDRLKVCGHCRNMLLRLGYIEPAKVRA